MARRRALPTIEPGTNLRGDKSIDEWQEAFIDIVTDEGQRLPFIDNPAQRLLSAHLDRAIAKAVEDYRPARGLIIKPRRAGFTTKLLARLTTRGVTETLLKFLYINANQKDTLDQFRDARGMYDRLPDSVRPTLLRPDATHEMAFVETGSRISTKFASVAGALRGKGFAEGMWDEAPRVRENLPTIEDQQRFLAGVLPAFRYAPFWMLFTPDGTLDITYHLWMESKRGENDWERILITHFQTDTCMIRNLAPEHAREIRETLTEEELFLLRHHTVPQREWAARIAWRRREIRAHPRLFFQENPEDDVSCWIAPGTSFFEQEDIAHQQANRRPVIAEGSDLAGPDNRWAPRYGGRLLYYLPPDPNHDYIVGSDFGVGHGSGDPSLSLVLDIDTNEIVAELCASDMDPARFAELTIRHLCEPYEEAQWAPEINSPGRAGIVHARRHPDLEYANIYRHAFMDGTTVRYHHEYGWPTTSGTRPVMLEELYKALRERGPGALRVNSERALADLQSFKLSDKPHKSSRYEAETGAHDEGPICLGIVTYIRQRGGARSSITFAE